MIWRAFANAWRALANAANAVNIAVNFVMNPVVIKNAKIEINIKIEK